MYTQNYNKIFKIFLFTIYKNEGENINLNDIEIKKNDFYKNKKINKIDDINVNNILVSKKEPYGTKKFI